jgi:hypothetical protein
MIKISGIDVTTNKAIELQEKMTEKCIMKRLGLLQKDKASLLTVNDQLKNDQVVKI